MGLDGSNSNGNGIANFGVDNPGRMTHDSATLHVLEDVNNSPDRPLHDRRHGKGQDTQSGPHYLAPARVAVRSALHASHIHSHFSSLEARFDNYEHGTEFEVGISLCINYDRSQFEDDSEFSRWVDGWLLYFGTQRLPFMGIFWENEISGQVLSLLVLVAEEDHLNSVGIKKLCGIVEEEWMKRLSGDDSESRQKAWIGNK
ncbi:hypothetical protein M0R45_002135 [Rubus argutus]|uniref:Uncharacterized protein n=1 Tax=Rubus argutus TaxID=59490 RepID=A0AAW1VJX3_RUBAR